MTPQRQPGRLRTALTVFGGFLLLLAGFGAIAGGIFLAFNGMVFLDGFASCLLLAVFVVLLWKFRLNWDDPTAAAIAVCLFAFFGMLMDSRGNTLYNAPLQWLFAPAGATLAVDEIISHGGGSTGIDYDFVFVDASGSKVGGISNWIVMPFRLLEYLVLGSLLVALVGWLRPRIRRGADWLPPS